MLDALRRMIEGRFPGGVALVSIDVDHFKQFNDNHGYDAGDMVLRAMGEVLSRHADGDRLACRIGGEELMLLLPGATEGEAMEEAERLRSELSVLSVRYGDRILPRITVSIGVALHPRHGALPQEVIRSADEALYLAKARGRDQVALAGSQSEASRRDLSIWTRDLDVDTRGRRPRWRTPPPIRANGRPPWSDRSRGESVARIPSFMVRRVAAEKQSCAAARRP